MSALPARKSTTESATVYPFPGVHSGEGSSSDATRGFVEELLGSPELEKRLKSILEASIASVYFRSVLERPRAESNPFDAIYISELIPDKIDQVDACVLARLSGIEDRSESITLVDGWED